MTTNIIQSAGAIGGTQFSVQTDLALSAFDLTTQNPAGLDNILQVLFGGAQSNPLFSLDALGNMTCLVSDEYLIRVLVQVGRTTVAGEAHFYMRSLVNGTPIGNSVFTRMDDDDWVIPLTFFGTLAMTAGQVFTVECYRDSAGINNGGLQPGVSALFGTAPSARVNISRNVAIVL